MYTETELETIGIISEKMVEKAREMGFYGAVDIEDAFECIMWRLAYLEELQHLEQLKTTLEGLESETQFDGTAHQDSVRREAETCFEDIYVASKSIDEIKARKPDF